MWASEINLPADLREPRGQHTGWRQPRAARGTERLLPAEHGRRVERVVDVDADVRTGASRSEDLRQSEIDLIDAIVNHLPRFQDVDGDVGGAPCERPAERLGHGG